MEVRGEVREARRAWPRANRETAVLAALDLGTNNCRLLIARPEARSFRVIDAFSRIVRLGEGLSRGNALSPQAMERTLAALMVCSEKMLRRGVTRARAVATEACRSAENCESFLARVQAQTGIGIEIISAMEEGRLALAGCAALLEPELPYALVFDIGGGSTELMWLRVARCGPPVLLDQISIRRGVVSLAERYGGDRVSPETYAAITSEITHALSAFEARHRIRQTLDAGEVQMLGTSGTVTTLAGMHQGLRRYERARVDGSYLSREEIQSVVRGLLALDYEGRASHPCVGSERADLVIAGCAVLEAILGLWPVPRLRIADRGLREGILVDLLAHCRGGNRP